MAERPKHVHKCKRPDEWTDADEWDEHEFICSSPYCTTIQRVCPQHGGKRPKLEQDD